MRKPDSNMIGSKFSATMAPNFANSQHQLRHDMIPSGSLTQAEMADVAHCSDRTIRKKSPDS
jgi:hypothetical protein